MEKIENLSEEKKLLDKLKARAIDTEDDPELTDLKTDSRVFARITDGIYRKPSSAIRELIFNAYDADATDVNIFTNRPKFDVITVQDNGNGMSQDTLVKMLNHIGGSVKRTSIGSTLGVTDAIDIEKSPGGRNLIGKLGIGLFAVVQLTRHFQIITTQSGESFSLIADIVIDNFSDPDIVNGESEFKAGTVELNKVSEDPESHGTTIYLFGVRPNIINQLQSKELWEILNKEEDDDTLRNIERPICHIGNFDNKLGEYIEKPEYPFKEKENSKSKMRSILDTFHKYYHTNFTKRYPNVEEIFDNYFQMIWDISISVPIKYIEKHPFELSGTDNVEIYKINAPKGGREDRPEKINLKKNETVREHLNYTSSIKGDLPFNLIIDDIEIFRPIQFLNLPSRTSSQRNDKVLFVSKLSDPLSNYHVKDSGGPIEVEASMFYNPIILPANVKGVQVLINGASGVQFDKQFFGYSVNEYFRLGKICVELHIIKGMDPALNLDRESFNVSHPHFVVVRKWMHFLLGRYINFIKYQSKQSQNLLRIENSLITKKNIDKIIFDEYQILKPDEIPPKVDFKRRTDLGFIEPLYHTEIQNNKDLHTVDNDNITFIISEDNKKQLDDLTEEQRIKLTNKLEAFGKLFLAYDIFNNLTNEKQFRLMNAILKILIEDN